MNETLQKALETLGQLIELPSKFDLLNKTLREEVQQISARMQHIENTAAQQQPQTASLPRYHYELDPKRPDESWDEIVKEGQRVQREFYIEGEQYWQNKLGNPPSGRGWYGTVSMPVITIVATAPNYEFNSTKRLPGRFRLWTPARWSSALRFNSSTGPVLLDNWQTANGIAYGFKTNAPIGIYVEPTVDVDAQFRTRPFEQSIENCLIVGQNGTLPIYLAQDLDRFWIRDCNIQQHGGAQVGIKHGPPISTSIITQPNLGHTYLYDPRFLNLQMEGPHNARRPQAAIFAAGSNIDCSGINLYGWMQGPYFHGGENRYVRVQLNPSSSTDGRQPFDPKLVCGAILNQAKDGETAESVGAPAFLYPPAATVASVTAGTHVKGEGLYGG